MAITRAQAYQQLVRKPSGEERPGYRGDDAYGGGRDPSGPGPSGTGNGGPTGPQELGMTTRGPKGPDDRGNRQQNINQRNIVREARIRDVEDFIDRPAVGFDDSATVNLLSPKSIVRGIVSAFNPLAGVLTSVGPFDNKQFFTEKVLTSKNPQDYDEDDYDQYMSDRMSGKIDAYGNPTGNDRGGNQILPVITPYQQSIVAQEPEEELTELQQMLADRGSLARRFAANGGIMDPNLVGGMMDGGLDEMGRQMYGLGKLVKKATRAVKKVASSPIGKAALLYAGAGGLGNLAAGKGFGAMFSNFLSPSKFLSTVPGIFSKAGVQNIASRIGLGSFKNTGGQRLFEANKLGSFLGSPMGMITAASLLPMLGIGTGDESEEEAQVILDQSGIDIADVRANPNKYLARRFAAEGGSMKEPVAKKVMPLLDLEGQEMDFRSEGGFVPIGRMEKADDVPARLSKNEFVFTADAVRNAGDGDIDKGAEVMYNMMKHLEDGGDVSEESQGLEGARNMFQTSQRLEEVL